MRHLRSPRHQYVPVPTSSTSHLHHHHHHHHLSTPRYPTSTTSPVYPREVQISRVDGDRQGENAQRRGRSHTGKNRRTIAWLERDPLGLSHRGAPQPPCMRLEPGSKSATNRDRRSWWDEVVCIPSMLDLGTICVSCYIICCVISLGTDQGQAVQ